MNIRHIKKGEVISESGAYLCDIEYYHTQDICPGPSVSSTGLRKVVNQSPHAFWKTWAANPDRYPDKEQGDSLILGKAAHSLILGDEVFDDKFVFVPKDAPRRPTATQVKAFERTGEWSEAAAEGAKFWTKFDKSANGKMELTPEQIQKVVYMSENLAANPLCVEMLKSDMIEVSMIWQDELTGLWVKSRPDTIPSNGFDFGDLKTFAPKSRNLKLAVQRSVTDFGYDMQMALAVIGAEATFGTTASRCGLAFIQTTEPYEAIPLVLDDEAIHWARIHCRHALDTIKQCMDAGDWPGAGIHPTTYTLPPSKVKEYEGLQSNGMLPLDF